MDINVDFTKITGEIKPVHGFNNVARETGYGELLPAFCELNPPVARLHDTCGEFGGTHYVDIPNIFPDFSKDENDENSYDFTYTDLYLKALHEQNIEIFFRFGVTIEHGPKKYQIYAPKNPEKWASICEHIVRHYNCGWANGFNWNIKYWEIWNEPDGLDENVEPNGPPMWIGTAEEYYNLYSITANLIKKNHPDIKIGGYSSCYILGAFRNGRWREGPTEYFTGFLDYITKTKAPLDFFTWHGYLGKNHVQKIEKEFNFIKKTLSEYGFNDTEIIDAEWNTNIDIGEKLPGRTLYYINMRNEYGASHAAAALYEMQRLKVDMAMFYDAQLWCQYGCLFNVPDLTPTKTYYAFKQFSEFYALKNECKIDYPEGVYTCAATGEYNIIGLSNINEYDIRIKLNISGAKGKTAEIILTDKNHSYESIEKINFDNEINITLKPYSFVSIKIK